MARRCPNNLCLKLRCQGKPSVGLGQIVATVSTTGRQGRSRISRPGTRHRVCPAADGSHRAGCWRSTSGQGPGLPLQAALRRRSCTEHGDGNFEPAGAERGHRNGPQARICPSSFAGRVQTTLVRASRHFAAAHWCCAHVDDFPFVVLMGDGRNSAIVAAPCWTLRRPLFFLARQGEEDGSITVPVRTFGRCGQFVQ